jgi:NAD+ synthase (glutamine-hydrolysing)
LKLKTRYFFVECGFSQAVLGLSGGIDSAVVAVVAVDALGKENVLGITMPSQFSSSGSIDDSLKLAKNLGIPCEIIPIENSFKALCQTLSPIFQGTEFNVAEENMQSRIRGLILMAISNKFNRLLLTTGNKSEMSVGYCTLYGDMNGALAVIGDIYKTDVYRIADYINRNGEIIPAETIAKAPSAELRPDQKDEDSLPPYSTLDKILKLLLEENKSCEEIIKTGEKKEIVEWTMRAVKNSRFKRIQAAPVLKLERF